MKKTISSLLFVIIWMTQLSYAGNRLPGDKQNKLFQKQKQETNSSARIKDEVNLEVGETNQSPFRGRERSYSKYSINILKKPLYA